ncbi:hypothetical protein AB5I41_26655 [Sphingomonas sp. MMS24-JH45]
MEAYTGRSMTLLPRALFRGCGAHHDRQARPRAAGAAGRLCRGRSARRSQRLAAPRHRRDRRPGSPAGRQRRRRTAATSSCCTTAAATGRRRWRRCRASSPR